MGIMKNFTTKYTKQHERIRLEKDITQRRGGAEFLSEKFSFFKKYYL